MKPLTKAAIVLAVVLSLCVAAWIPLRGALQFRAIYPGGLTFIGQADGLLGTHYHRVYLWRSPEDAAPLPDVTVHLRNTPYRLSELTSELMQTMGGGAGEGGVKDAAGCSLNYRFENGRLTFFALSPTVVAMPGPAPAGQVDRFRLQVGKGTPFLLPITQSQLVRVAGRPIRVTRNIAN